MRSTDAPTALWLAAAMLVAWTAGPGAGADDLPDTPTLANACRAGWIRFTITSGRVTLAGSRGINVATGAEGVGRKERLSVRIGAGEPALEYERIGPDQDLAVQMAGRNRLHLRRTPKGASRLVPVEYEQPAQGPVTLRVGAKEQSRAYQASSLWHLLVIEPDVSRQHLAPLFRLLNPDWDLGRAAAEVEATLIAAAKDRRFPDKRRWAQWVEQLGDPRFAKREEADRRLREAGRIVVAYLQQLDLARLDAEQRYRVRRIILALSDDDQNDSPEQTAAWLAGDPAVWLAMLSREEVSTRQIAAEQLSALVGEKLAFDPGADAPTRKAQIDQIRARIGK
ncbi:MAG: hypothetical protein NUV77_19265 [Thermoguttaceae bacterium]|jgi:hypothetical protein|nr:hypothetical protein [Thermoguttaceae bacterium]